MNFHEIYKGTRTNEGCVVTIDGDPLDPRLDIRNHSPSGFEWGYSGSGPSQLALAILAHFFGDDDMAQQAYQNFKTDVIAGIETDEWVLTSKDIAHWLGSHVPVFRE